MEVISGLELVKHFAETFRSEHSNLIGNLAKLQPQQWQKVFEQIIQRENSNLFREIEIAFNNLDERSGQSCVGCLEIPSSALSTCCD
jgi:hypothetical protein